MSSKSKSGSNVKPSVKKRTLNVTGSFQNETTAGKIGAAETKGAPPNEQDVQRRLGNYGGAGEHPRQGGRQSGIVGQTKKTLRSNKKGK
jgi:hypothetical protein